MEQENQWSALLVKGKRQKYTGRSCINWHLDVRGKKREILPINWHLDVWGKSKKSYRRLMGNNYLISLLEIGPKHNCHIHWCFLWLQPNLYTVIITCLQLKPTNHKDIKIRPSTSLIDQSSRCPCLLLACACLQYVLVSIIIISLWVMIKRQISRYHPMFLEWILP